MHYNLGGSSQMNQLLFEKLIVKSDVSTEEMIACSEKRRSMIDNMDRDVLPYVNNYYAAYVQMMRKLTVATLRTSLCFNGTTRGRVVGSEKIHLEDLMMTTLWKKALTERDLKRRQLLQGPSPAASMRWAPCPSTTGKTPRSRAWTRCRTVTTWPHMQGSRAYYKTMNQFSIDTKSVSKSMCFRMALEYMDVACNVWKSDKYDREERDAMHAQYLLSVAQQMEDDRCGEKVALLKDVVETAPQAVVSQYNIWKQQNEQVYYQKEETDFKIAYSSLQDLFRNLQTIVSGK